jgi:putative ABC transport system permease protein
MKLSDIAFRTRALLARQGLESQVDEEFAFHLRMETEKLMNQGMNEADAGAEARRRFGNVTREHERARDAWGVRLGYDLIGDVRHAIRQLRRRPGFSLIAILTLGLGIGATAAIFTVVNGMLLRPLPYANEDRLQEFWMQYSWRGNEYDHIREGSLAFDQIVAYSALAESMRLGDETQMLSYIPATANLFDAVGAKPMLGRGFEPGEDRPGAEPVIVISHGLWQQELGSDPNVIGRTLEVGGTPRTIVGVMPPGFFFPTPDNRAWRPLILDPADPMYANTGWLTLIGLERAGTTTVELRAELDRITRQLGERFTYPAAWDKTKDATTRPLRDALVGNVRDPLLLLLGAVAMLLVIACANAAALILARTTDRMGELTVRSALGAGRYRIARQIVTESLVLAMVSAITGALIASLAFKALVASLPLQQGFGTTLSMGWQAFAMAFALALLIGVVVSIVPIRQLLRGRLDGLSRERSEQGLRFGTRRAHGTMIAAQVTVAVMLVAGAMLLVRSVERIRALDPGFDPRGIAVVDLVASSSTLTPAVRTQFFADALARIEAMPGVTGAGLTNRLPVRDQGWQGTVGIEGKPEFDGAARPNSLMRTATPGYLQALGIAIRSGRGIEASDRAGGELVVLISESFAAKVWPGENPIGKRIQLGQGQAPWRRIVGVAEEARMTSITGDIPFTTWVPHDQFPGLQGATAVIRSDLPAATVYAGVRSIVAALNDRVAVARPMTMETVVATSLAEPLRLRFFLGLFAGLALLLGSVGVYGVVSYAVARRRAEFGIRMALGAAPSRVLTDVVRHGLTPVVIGVVAGLAGSIALSGLLRGFLYDVSPRDTPSLFIATGALLLAGVLAAFVPAWKAGATSPVEALRSD